MKTVPNSIFSALLPRLVLVAFLTACQLDPTVVGTMQDPPAPTVVSEEVPTAAPVKAGRPDAETSYLRTVDSLGSPTGEWLAQVRTDLPLDHQQPDTGHYRVEVRVISQDGVSILTLLLEQRAYGLGYTMPKLVRWSQDTHSLFISEQSIPDGCAPFEQLNGLWRFDTTDGQVTMLIPQSNALAISPDETQVAYIGGQGFATNELVVQELQTANYATVLLEPVEVDAQFGAIVWSPVGNELVLTAAYHPCQSDGSQTILHVDVNNRVVALLLQQATPSLRTAEWLTSSSQIGLVDQQGRHWTFDLATHEISLIPTPDLFVSDFAWQPLVSLRGTHIEAISHPDVPLPVALAIPPDLCPPYELHTWVNYRCAQQIEAFELEQGVPGIARANKQLSIDTVQGTVIFTDQEAQGGDDEESYSYLGFLPMLGHHLVSVHYFEGGEYLLINRETGELTQIPTMPVVNGDGSRFATVQDVQQIPYFEILFWQVDSPAQQVIQPEKQIIIPHQTFYQDPTAFWSTNHQLMISVVPFPQQIADQIVVDLNATDITITYNGEPANRPALQMDYYPGRTDAIRQIDTLRVGSYLYADRDYIFTSVPAQLDGQPYFRFNNDNMHVSTADYTAFHLYRPATLYIAIDEQACALPGWMADWEPVNETITTTDIGLKLYSKGFPEGDVMLGANEAPPAACIRSHYLVFMVQSEG
jgi:hypothetical protein